MGINHLEIIDEIFGSSEEKGHAEIDKNKRVAVIVEDNIATCNKMIRFISSLEQNVEPSIYYIGVSDKNNTDIEFLNVIKHYLKGMSGKEFTIALDEKDDKGIKRIQNLIEEIKNDYDKIYLISRDESIKSEDNIEAVIL